jgi:hypothetical protein
LGQHVQGQSLDSSFGLPGSIDAADSSTLRSNSNALSNPKSSANLIESTANGDYSQLLSNKEDEMIGSECSSPEFVIANEQANGSFFTPLKPWQELESRHQPFRCPEQAGFLHVEDDAHHHLLGNEEDEPLTQALRVLNGKTVTSYRCFTNEDEEEMEDETNRRLRSNSVENGKSIVTESQTNESQTSERKLSAENHLNWINGNGHFELRTDEQEEDDVWTISDQQLRYFHSKFVELSGGTCRPLAGSEVRSFLEKSKLPLLDLKKIWQLSDLDQDGQLSLAEFCISVQLIVLRRNQVELPDTLPKSLQPERWAYRLSLLGLQVNVSVDPSEIALLDEPISPLVSKQWTKFSNSPEPSAPNKKQNDDSLEELSESATTAMQPAKFDHIELDPRIPHPIAVKATQAASVQRSQWNANEADSVVNTSKLSDALAK